MVPFSNWIWGLFPDYFHDNDSYKDANDKGLLERYVTTFGNELDENFIPFAENVLDLLDALKADDRYLVYLSYFLGSPISIDSNAATYRRILQYAVAIYKIKGTQKSYQLLFNLIGIDIQILEEMPKRPTQYDEGNFYDDGHTYDESCEYCTYYTIAYGSLADTTEPTVVHDVPPEMLMKFTNIICFLQPINAKLRGYQKKITFNEEFVLNTHDQITGFNVDTDGAFSGGFDIDNQFN